MDSERDTKEWRDQNGRVARAGDRALLRCERFSCLGVLQADGTWNSLYGTYVRLDVVLVVQVVPSGEPAA
jgi:hypothetical protein